jgi:hypothetical protein
LAIFAAGEEVRHPRTDDDAADRAHVTREGELERAGSEIPDLDNEWEGIF